MVYIIDDDDALLIHTRQQEAHIPHRGLERMVGVHIRQVQFLARAFL